MNRLLLRILLWLATWWAAASAVPAAEPALRASKPETKKEIVAVIEAQLAAFRKDDPALAYTFSSVRLRAQRPLRSFSAIVRGSYPEIWHSRSAEFGLARDDGEQARIPVHVTAAEGGEATFDYLLVKERVGWRIAGVLRREPGRGEQL